MKKLLILASIAFALCFVALPQSQAGIRVGVGFCGPRISVGVGVPVYYGPAYYAAPVYYAPAPVVYRAPVYYARPRGRVVYYGRVCR